MSPLEVCRVNYDIVFGKRGGGRSLVCGDSFNGRAMIEVVLLRCGATSSCIDGIPLMSICEHFRLNPNAS